MNPYQRYQVPLQEIVECIDTKNINNAENPKIILSVSPCRSGSSVMLRVFGAVGIPSYLQPLKNILRWKMMGADASWKMPQNSAVPVYVKETLGPYTKAEATFNPLLVLLEAGFLPENLHLLILGRDPLHTWASWLAWWKGKTTIELFISAYITTENIRKMAISNGIHFTTMTYELFRDYKPEIVIRNLFQRLDIEYRPIAVEDWGKLPQYGASGSNIYLVDEHPVVNTSLHAYKRAKTSKKLVYTSRLRDANELNHVDIEKITNNNLFNVHKQWMDDAKICLSL